MKRRMESRFRRIMSWLLTLVMLVQFLPAISFFAEETDKTFSGFSKWTLSGGTMTTGSGLSGNGAVITPNGTGAVLQSDAMSASDGEQLRGGIFVKMPEGGKAELKIQFYADTLGKKAKGEAVSLDAQDAQTGFTELAGDFTVPAGVASMRMQVVTGTSGVYTVDDGYVKVYSELPELSGVMGDGDGIVGTWSQFYPLGYATGDWAEQLDITQDPNGFNYAQIEEDGMNDEGAVRFLRNDVYEHIGIAIGSELAIGQEYTVKMWVKGNAVATYGGLQLYGHGDLQLATFGTAGECKDPDQWYEITRTITATRNHLYIFMSGGAYSCDVLIDHVEVLDSQGRDMLEGAGHFTGDGTSTLKKGNRLQNPGFEDATYSYLPLSEFNGTFQDAKQDTSNLQWRLNEGSEDGLNIVASEEGKCLQVTKKDSASLVQSTVVEVVAKATYQLSLDWKTTGTGVLVGVFYNADGEMISQWEPELTCEADQWENQKVFVEVPENGAFFQIGVQFTGTAGDTLHLDNVAVYPCTAEAEPETAGWIPAELNTTIVSAYDCTDTQQWHPMYPAGSPDGGTWAGWSASSHYGEVVAEGHNDTGALHLKSNVGKNAGVAINAGMTAGQKYTLSLWAKGTSNSGRVLSMYANGDPVIIGEAQNLTSEWKQYSITFTASQSQINIMAADWGVTDIYLDNITLQDASGNDLLSGKGDFCTEQAGDSETTGWILAELNTTIVSAYDCTDTQQWHPMYPTGSPESGTWGAWSATSHYVELAVQGHNDPGSLHMKSNVGKNVGVAINAGMTAGQKYTLTLWAKGTSNSGSVMISYGNGDFTIIGTAQDLGADWTKYQASFTATMSQLNLIVRDWGVSDVYVDNITLTDAGGKDLLANQGDFATRDPNYSTSDTMVPDTSVNLLEDGDFEGVATLTIPGWSREGTVTLGENGLVLAKGAFLQSLRYNVEAGQILSASWTGTDGMLLVQFGKDDQVLQTQEIPVEGTVFSACNDAQWIRVLYGAVDKTATISEIELTDMGDPANLDFEIKDSDSDLPMNWSYWVAINDQSVSGMTEGAYTVQQQVGTGIDDSNSLMVTLNKDVAQNATANALTGVVDSIPVKVEPNTTYSFSFYAKMDAENGCIYPSVRCLTASGSADGATQWMNGAYVTDDSGEWRQYKTSFSTGSNTEYICFRLELKASNAGAQFWADRITYKVLGSATDTNLDFELGEEDMVPLNWYSYERNISSGAEGVFGDYQATWKPYASGNGTAALKVQKSNGNNTEMYVCSTLIKVDPNSAYYFGYEAATVNAANNDQILIMLQQKKANGEGVSDSSKAYYWPVAAYATGHFNWSDFGAVFETAADCEYIRIMFCFRGSSGYTAFVDNVELTKTEKIENPNLDFEYSVGNVPLNWEFNGVLATGSMTVSSENVYSGNQALRILREDGELDFSFAYGTKNIPVTAGDKIEVVANISSRNAISGHFSMVLIGHDGTEYNINESVNAIHGQERITNADSQWSQWDTYEVVWTVPKGVNYIQICLRVGGTRNDVLIDDITFYNYTQNENLIYSENFKNPSVTTGLPGGWIKGEMTGNGEAKVNGQMSLTGDEASNAEIYTQLYTLKTDYVYALTANAFTTGTAKGQLVMEAVNWDGSVAGQPVVLDVNTEGTEQELKANFEALSAVYYRLYLRKTEGDGSVCVSNITLHQTGEPYMGITWAGYWLTHPDETARISQSPHPFTERHYYYRTEINLDKTVETAQMQITADDKFTLYINGMQVYDETRTGDTWDLPVTVDIAEYLQPGKNVIAVDLFNNIYLYGLIFDGIIKMEDESSLRFFSTSDTMIAAECYSDEITPTRNAKWTEEDQMNWMQTDYDISTCSLWMHADQYASIGGGGWGDISFDPTEYSDYKIISNEFTFPSEDITAGEIVTVTAQFMLEKALPEESSFQVDIWKRNTTSRICSSTLTIAGGKSTADWPVGEEFTAEFELLIPQFLAEGKYTIQLDNTVSIVSDYFINNKIGNVSVVQIERPLTTTSSVETIDGKVQMVVNGEIVAPMWYARPERPAQFQEHIVTEFGEVGVDTIVTYVFLNNTYGDVWTQDGFVSDLVDSMMLDTLAGNPDAKLMVALDFNAPQWWMEENPGELVALSEETVTKQGASFASQKWKEESGAIMVDAINHMMSQPYANNIIGFKVTGGYTLEWNWWAMSDTTTDVGDFSQCGIDAFRTWLTEKYGTDATLQEAYGDNSLSLETILPPSVEQRKDYEWNSIVSIQDNPYFVDYHMYMAQIKVDTVEYFVDLVTEAIDDRLIVGTYAGYFFMGGGYDFNCANHYFQSILEIENLDFVKTPWMYGMREIGDSGQFMGPVDSVYAHEKLWIIEEDSRLNLKEMSEGQDGRASVGWTRNYQQSVEQLKRNFAYVLAKGMGISFYNLMWDFTDDAQYYGVIGQMHQEMTLSLGLSSESVADIAVFVNGESLMTIPVDTTTDQNNGLYASVYREQLEELGHVGASYDIYLLEDLKDGLVPEHKINIFMGTTWVTEEDRAAIESQLQKDGNILVWIFTSGLTDGTATDLALLEDAVDMDLTIISKELKQIATAKIINNDHWLTDGMNIGRPYGVKGYDKMAPVIAITDPTVTPLAYHSTTSTTDGTPEGSVALGVKDMGDWTCVYSAVPMLPQAMIRNMLKKIGAHNYTESGSDVIYANKNYVALHSIFAGERTIELPGNYTVYDVFNREIIATNTDSFTVTLDGKETRLFRLTEPNTVQVYMAKNQGGTVSHPGLTTLTPGDSLTVTIEPDPGYRLNYLMVDSKKISLEGNTYSFDDLQESHTVIANFTPSYGQGDADDGIAVDNDSTGGNSWLLPVISGGTGLLAILAVIAAFILSKRKKTHK